ncbi:MAG: hypothetical protein Q6K55_11840 [Thermostichus sp. DG02_3_bins_51]
MVTLHPGRDLTQPLVTFLQGLNWDNRPPAVFEQALGQDLPLASSDQPFFTQSVGQFFASCNWSGIRPCPEQVSELPEEDPFTLDDFAALFGGALL